jgi:anti-sigma28 factor (negative regulator of flagellin synthesis)
LNDTKAQIDIVNLKIASEPDIRPEKIAEVQEKIQNGFYNSDDFVDKLATKLLDEFGIKQTP